MKKTAYEYLAKTIFPVLDEQDTKESVKTKIRNLADTDENFENLVFEVGCSVLAKYTVKRGRK